MEFGTRSDRAPADARHSRAAEAGAKKKHMDELINAATGS